MRAPALRGDPQIGRRNAPEDRVTISSSPPDLLIGSGQATGGASPALMNSAASVSLNYSLVVEPDATLTGKAITARSAATSRSIVAGLIVRSSSGRVASWSSWIALVKFINSCFRRHFCMS